MRCGIIAPSTQLEDERLGRFSGPLKDEAKRSAQDTAQKVKGVAQDAYSAAKDELRRKGEEVAGSESLHQLVD